VPKRDTIVLVHRSSGTTLIRYTEYRTTTTGRAISLFLVVIARHASARRPSGHDTLDIRPAQADVCKLAFGHA
jgi:hypothetical protein